MLFRSVAIVSRVPLLGSDRREFCQKGDARHISVDVSAGAKHAPITIHNFYIPAGGDEPDPATNEKFAHKLAFLDEATAWFAADKNHARTPAVMVGDLNIAPLVERARSGGVREIVLATSATVDGQTTAHYVTERLKGCDIAVTRLAHGVPVGGELDYLEIGRAHV